MICVFENFFYRVYGKVLWSIHRFAYFICVPLSVNKRIVESVIQAEIKKIFPKKRPIHQETSESVYASMCLRFRFLKGSQSCIELVDDKDKQ